MKTGLLAAHPFDHPISLLGRQLLKGSPLDLATEQQLLQLTESRGNHVMSLEGLISSGNTNGDFIIYYTGIYHDSSYFFGDIMISMISIYHVKGKESN